MSSEGRRFLDEGRFEEALESFSGSEDAHGFFGRAVALQLLARFEEAEAAYGRLLAAHPGHEEALANLIAMNVEKFDLARIEQYARRLLEISPDAPVALEGLIVVAVERRDFDLAASCFARLSRLEEAGRDAVEYRLSRHIVERLKDHHGSVAHPR